jgi:hypothetical protein
MKKVLLLIAILAGACALEMSTEAHGGWRRRHYYHRPYWYDPYYRPYYDRPYFGFGFGF